MAAFNSIAPDRLFRLIGTSHCPAIIDVKPDSASLIPSSRPMPPGEVEQWADRFTAHSCVVVCVHGKDTSHGVAAWLRHKGIDAEVLEGGFAAWQAAGLPVVEAAKLPPRKSDNRTAWVTRARPKVDRIACPWLIRRFVDPGALFLFVPPAEVEAVSKRFDAAPFDVENTFWSHRGEQCTFDVMIDELGLGGFEPLTRLAIIVRGADTARPDLAPQAAGLLAASLGLSRIYASDLEQLDAGMILYDALYRWCRDAVDETHDWVSHTPRPKRRR